jgi:hypothetical protein
MPKDPTKNIFQYKIRGGHLNEYEFHQNQGDVTEQQLRPWEKENYDPNALMPGEQPEVGGKGREKVLARPGKSTTTKVAKSAKKPAKKSSAKTPRTPASKKTAKKAVSKKTTRKSAVKKSTSRKASPTRRAKKAATTRRSAKK